jgi:predicted acetyltransferase
MINQKISADDIISDEYDAQKEAEEFSKLPVIFTEFIDLPTLADDEIELVCIAKKPAIPEKKYVPAYEFEIRKDGNRIGDIGLRIGYTEGLYYCGNIGFGVDELFRGHGYAAMACNLLIPIMKAHGMKKITITNDIDNIPSKRTCEKVGAKFIRIARLPEWTELYSPSRRFSNIYEWSIE